HPTRGRASARRAGHRRRDGAGGERRGKRGGVARRGPLVARAGPAPFRGRAAAAPALPARGRPRPHPPPPRGRPVSARPAPRPRPPVAFSRGHHPLPRLSFGPGLPVGASSEDELLDIDLSTVVPAAEARARLATELPDGLELLGAVEIPRAARSI